MVWPGGHTWLVALPDFYMPLSLAGFPISAPGLDETTFDVWL